MNKNLFINSLLLIFTSISFGQIEIQKYKGLVSTEAYSKKISEDFNYLLFGENSPKQGISVILNDDKSNVKINGLLYSGKYGVLNLEADLSASDGFYFFDQNNGSEKGKISFNYYKPLKRWSEFYPIDNLTKANIKLQTLELITQAKSDYNGLRSLIEEILGKEILDDKTEVIKAFKTICEKYLNSDDEEIFEKLVELKFDESNYSIKSDTTESSSETVLEKDTARVILIDGYGLDKNLKIDNVDNKKIGKILKDYAAKRKFIIKKLEDSINKLELKNVESQWAGNYIFFVGISPFYERQGFKRFSYDNSKTFSDMFNTEKGDAFGINMSLNFSLEKGKGSRNIYKPRSLFLRLSTSLNRASNISNFKNSTLAFSSSLGNDVNGNPIEFTNSDKAFIGDTAYEYGFGNSLNFEAYYYPFPVPIGFFGKIGYETVKFKKKTNLNDIEKYPMRLGLLFSLKNKEDNKKPLITIQAFLDRTDLNLSPNGSDKDLRFGLGIGLPINIK